MLRLPDINPLKGRKKSGKKLSGDSYRKFIATKIIERAEEKKKDRVAKEGKDPSNTYHGGNFRDKPIGADANFLAKKAAHTQKKRAAAYEKQRKAGTANALDAYAAGGGEMYGSGDETRTDEFDDPFLRDDELEPDIYGDDAGSMVSNATNRTALYDVNESDTSGWSAYIGDTEAVAKRTGLEDQLPEVFKERAAARRGKAVYMDSVDRAQNLYDRAHLTKMHGVVDEMTKEEKKHLDSIDRLGDNAVEAEERRGIMAEQFERLIEQKKADPVRLAREEARAKEEKIERGVASPESFWECPTPCTKHNSWLRDKCELCNEKRPKWLVNPRKRIGKRVKRSDGFGRKRLMTPDPLGVADHDGLATELAANSLTRTQFQSRKPTVKQKCKACGARAVLATTWYKPKRAGTKQRSMLCQGCMDGANCDVSQDAKDDMLLYMKFSANRPDKPAQWYKQMVSKNPDPLRENSVTTVCWKCGSPDPKNKDFHWYRHPGTRHRLCFDCSRGFGNQTGVLDQWWRMRGEQRAAKDHVEKMKRLLDEQPVATKLRMDISHAKNSDLITSKKKPKKRK